MNIIFKIIATLGFIGAVTSSCARPSNTETVMDDTPQTTTLQEASPQQVNVDNGGDATQGSLNSGVTNQRSPTGHSTVGSTAMGSNKITGGSLTDGSTAATSNSNTGTSTTANTGSVNTDIVRKAQSELSRKGYNVPVNGVLETRTEQALRNFQRDSGLQPTGNLDKATLNALQIASGSNDNRAPASVAEPIN